MTTPSGIAPDSITHRRILAVALPIVISNATEPIKGAVDTGVVGQLGLAAPIGAVGIGAVVLAMLYMLFSFLRMGTSGLVAQARGAGDVAETGAIVMRGLLMGAAGGLLFLLLQTPFYVLAFSISPASDEVETLARDYLSIRALGAPATLAYFAATGWLIAMEKTRQVMILQIWINGVNIALDLWFVLGLGWGVEGVATATVIAEWTGLCLALWFCRPAFSGDQWRDWARIFNPDRLRKMAAVSGDIMIRSIILNAMFITFLFYGAAFGDVTLAANQVLLQFLEITAFALDGFAFAIEALVGQAMGARMVRSLRRAVILTTIWMAVLSLVLSVFFLVAGPALIDLMTTAPDVRAEARSYLAWAALSPLIGCAAWMLDGVFIGATRTAAMRRAAIESGVVYALAVWALGASLDNHGLWLALWVSFVIRAATLAWRYPALEAAAATSEPS